MESRVIELYSPAYLDRLRKLNKIRKNLLLILIIGGLAACIVLCTQVNTKNSLSMMFWVMGISTVTGWLAIYLYLFGYRASKREILHGENLSDGKRETVTGTVEYPKIAYRIQNSINVRKLKVETEKGPVTVNINSTRSRELQKAGKRLKLYLVHGYVTAYEVEDESI